MKNNIWSVRPFITVSVLLLLVQLAVAQQENIVSFHLKTSSNVNVGDTVSVAVHLQVRNGWYIYAPAAANVTAGMQPTRLLFDNLPHGIYKSGALKLPRSTPEKQYLVYKGNNIIISQTFRVSENAVKGKNVLNARLTYQACSETLCHPPVSEMIPIILYVQ